MKEHLPLIRQSGCRALWLGVEDMTATLVKKGQSVDKTTEAFQLLRAAGICPMPMMMHHDSQPLYSPGPTTACSTRSACSARPARSPSRS